jgi:hypothetical protein
MIMTEEKIEQLRSFEMVFGQALTAEQAFARLESDNQ